LVGRRTALNVVQKIPGITFTDNPIVVGVVAIDIYTVPTNHKAMLKSLFTRAVSFGTNTFMQFQLVTLAGVNLRLERATVVETALTEKLVNSTGILLQAGTIIRLNADGVANNGSMGYDIKIEETLS